MKIPHFARSLRFRLLVASLAIEVFMLALLVGNSLRLIDEHMIRQTEHRITANELAYKTAVALPLAARDYATLRDIIDGWRQAEDIVYMAVTDPTGQILATSGWPDGKPLPVASSRFLKGETFHVAFPVQVFDQHYGVVHYGLSLSFLEAAWHDLLLQGSVIASAELFLSFLMLFGVGYWLTRHLAFLAEASSKIAAGDYQTRLRSVADDEVGLLTHNFNRMAEAVESRIGELATHLARQKTILAALGEGVYGLDKNGRCAFVNPAALALLGYTEDEVLGRDTHALFHHTRIDGTPYPGGECPVHLTCLDGQRRTLEDWLWRKDGSRFPVAITVTALILDGELSGAVVAFRDISEAHQAAEALRDSRDRLAAFINALPDIVVLKDGGNRWQMINQAAENVLHLKGHPWQGKTNRQLGDERPAFKAFHDAASQTDDVAWQRKAMSLSVEHIYADGEAPRTSEVRKMPLFAQDGSPKALMVIARDVTEQKQAEAKLHQLNETLEQRVQDEVAKNMAQERLLIQQSRLAAMGEMIHNIAHHWRQPINALNLLLANIKDAYDYKELDDAYIEQAATTGDRLIQQLSATIDNFRDYFRSDQELSPFKLEDAVATVLNILGPTLENSRIKVVYSAAPSIVVRGYLNELTQTIINIVNNAKDVILDQNLPEGRITISAGSNGANAWLKIADNGGGIPPKVLQKIFDPYFTTKTQGTGLGLYMSKMLMRHMNGDIRVANENGGAVFILELPLENAGAGQSVAPASQAR